MRNYLPLLLLLITIPTFKARAQKPVTLTLKQTIEIANDSSLTAYRYLNVYLSGYWEYRTYRANRLPSLTLKATPAQYYRDITKRYDSENNIDVYRQQQSFSVYGNLALQQNFDLTGGTFYVDTELGYIHNFGATKYTQYTSVPFRIGYSQSLIGYNAFRWDRKIQPLKYEKQKKELIYNMELVSEEAIGYFFSLAMAQAKYDLAKENVHSTDTLYRTGMKRHEIVAISQADLLTLKLDAVNARNTFRETEISLKRAMFSLASYLNLDKNTQIRLELPQKPVEQIISAEEALQIAKRNNPKFLSLKQSILEAERSVDKTKKESRFNVSMNASVGFNQVADDLAGAYRKPMQQDLISLSISVPIVDWGVRKGKYNMAKNNLNVVQISARQEELQIEEDVLMTVDDFNSQISQIRSAEEALELSRMAYNETKQRFMIGKADINSLTLSLSRQQTAQQNYISALKNYWLNYYKIRRLTLYDFNERVSLATLYSFDSND